MEADRTEVTANPTQLIAYAAHGLMTPLAGVQLSLSRLTEDKELKQLIGPHQYDLLHTAASCSDVLLFTCQQFMDGLGDGNGGGSSSASKTADYVQRCTANNVPFTFTGT
jgi:hypothetical protein